MRLSFVRFLYEGNFLIRHVFGGGGGWFRGFRVRALGRAVCMVGVLARLDIEHLEAALGRRDVIVELLVGNRVKLVMYYRELVVSRVPHA